MYYSVVTNFCDGQTERQTSRAKAAENWSVGQMLWKLSEILCMVITLQLSHDLSTQTDTEITVHLTCGG